MAEKNIKIKLFRFSSTYQEYDFKNTIEKVVNDKLENAGITELNILELHHSVSEVKGTKGLVDTILILYKK